MASEADRVRRWREHLKGHARSGMSREAYCAWHGLSCSTLYRWERRLRGESSRSRTQAVFEAMEWIAVEPPASETVWPWVLRSDA